MSKYLCDQGKRTHLLDYMASMYENIQDFTAELLTMDLPNISPDEMEARRYRATTLAMDLEADWAAIHPMLTDIYNDTDTVDIPASNA